MTSKSAVNADFYEKAKRAFRNLFDAARAKHELHFALALIPELRGMQASACLNEMEVTPEKFHGTSSMPSLSEALTSSRYSVSSCGSTSAPMIRRRQSRLDCRMNLISSGQSTMIPNQVNSEPRAAN